jgi:hypothetical protein
MSTFDIFALAAAGTTKMLGTKVFDTAESMKSSFGRITRF